ncbi:unnamed protein product [Adineta ricciae]|uniref:MARVEL domain-containing protein n=1 Tax=Adineta ricciae TaxID=249248 RepID=A0A814B0M4_ADIRI|nr:unnamed protein product [Adineta ricciae]CAF0921638.1 unnamed protein product [Adineta ricciae]
MQAVQSKLSVHAVTSYLGVFKEPRGLIRLFQIIFAILAFATACNGRSSTTLDYGGKDDVIASSWSYPYRLSRSAIVLNNGTILGTLSTSNDPKPPAEFFLFTSVMAMLLALTFTFTYVFLNSLYRNNDLFPTLDFFITFIWTIFWLAGSSAWAQGVTNIRSLTDFDNIRQRSGICPSSTICPDGSVANYANLIVSVLFGFLNFVLWLGSLWFVFKETRFFKSHTMQQPQVQAPVYPDIGSPSMQPQSYTQSPVVMT